MQNEQAAALLGAERAAATDRVVSLGRRIRQLAEQLDVPAGQEQPAT
jgi:hypothetical protein